MWLAKKEWSRFEDVSDQVLAEGPLLALNKKHIKVKSHLHCGITYVLGIGYYLLVWVDLWAPLSIANIVDIILNN